MPEIGYACDVGASDGELFSNTLYYERKGWTVLCVEPNPLLEEHGRSVRKLWVRAACGNEHLEAADFSIYGQYPYGSNSSLGSVCRFNASVSPSQTFQVEVFRLDQLLETHGFPQLDLLCIDVEGWEPEVLSGLDLERWKPTILVVEEFNCDFPTPTGYRRLDKLEFDVVFQRID